VSPSRLLLLRALAVVATVVVVFAVLARVTRTDKPAPAAADQGKPGPVVLVPGYGGGTRDLASLAAHLRATGREATILELPGDGKGDLRAQAKALGTQVDAVLAASGAASVDLVGYSAGGVVTRLYVAGDGRGKVRRVITLGSPHHGTKVAGLAQAFDAGQCTRACQQMVPGSSLLDGLADTPPGPQWLSLWTAQDETVTPPSTAKLNGAVDVVLQDVCPGVQIGHGDLPDAPLVVGIVLAELGTAPLSTPTGCSALTAAGR
jgi:triacylglycerol lipase